MPFSKAKKKIELEKGWNVVGSGRNTLSCGFRFLIQEALPEPLRAYT